MTKYNFNNIKNNLNKLKWLDYKQKHILDPVHLNPLCLYILLELYYRDYITFFDPVKLSFCKNLARIHFVSLQFIDTGVDYTVSHAYCITPIGRQFVRDCVPRPLLRLTFELGSVIFQRFLYIIGFITFMSGLALLAMNASRSTLAHYFVILGLVSLFLLINSSVIFFWHNRHSNISKWNFINFIDYTPISKSYIRFVKWNSGIDITHINYYLLTSIMEHLLFKRNY